MKKKNILALITLLAVLLTALTGCGSNDRVAELEAENAALKSQVEGLTAQLQSLGNAVGLASWTLDATPWSSSNGANVVLTAIPLIHQEGQTAAFTVWLEGDMLENVPCEWNGESFTAAVDLNAADGYCYYCVLTAPDGTQTEIDVNTPNQPMNEALINMESALGSYCNLMLDTSAYADGKLTLSGGYAQVQLPRISAGDTAYKSAELVLTFEEKEVARQSLTLAEGEGEMQYEADLTGITFDIPDMEDDQQLDLRMDVVLSDGQTLTTPGASWFYLDGDLLLAVG